MTTINQQEGNMLQIMADKLMAKRKVFYWTLPLVFVLSFVLCITGVKTYSSQLTISVEDQLAIEQNRVYTHHHPENYDLAVMRTDPSMGSTTYEEIIGGQDFCLRLLQDTVQTINGQFVGTMKEYLQKEFKLTFWKKPYYILGNYLYMLKNGNNTEIATVEENKVAPKIQILSKDDFRLINQVKGMITCDVDEETGIVTLTTETQDNLVSKMLLEYVYDHLSQFIRDYQFEKMELALAQLEKVRDDAHEEYLAAKAAKSPETERLESIFRSFERQVVVYKAQMMYHPAINKLTNATLSYETENSNPLVLAIEWTLIITLLIGIWICRKEIMEWF